MKYYVISDTHFNHDAIIKYCDRPENHEELIFNNLMQLTDQHCLLHLGDVCIGDNQEMHDKYIKPLKCKKILIKGNHDPKSYTWYMNNGWDYACHTMQLKYAGRLIHFSHKPSAWDGFWDMNIHGHLHNLGGHRKDEYPNLKQWHRLYSPELMNYKPIELSEFVQKET